jgi:dolichol-phosphate mannosyltransferase
MHFTIVIPTYNERENVRLITKRVRNILQDKGYIYEILFIDDSCDDTPNVLEQLANEISEVRYIHRQGARGLASAVVEGFDHAKGEYIIVMDADLQHPPELIPLIVTRLTQSDVVIPSRFISGGSDGGLNWFRKLVSWSARTIGRFSIKRLRDISDCTSGYFGINREVVKGVKLEPIGWKILMEVLVKGHYSKVHEVPYAFEARDAGQSKMSLCEQWNYIKHVIRLIRYSPEDSRFCLFCMIGTLGVFVNLFILSILLTVFQIDGFISSIAASVIAMAHNFLWNDNLTWKDHQNPTVWRRVLQFPQFVLICGFGIGITAFFARSFVLLDWNIYLGQLAGIFLATFWSFSANNRWTWAGSPQENICKSKLTVTQERV